MNIYLVTTDAASAVIVAEGAAEARFIMRGRVSGGALEITKLGEVVNKTLAAPRIILWSQK